MVKESQIIRLPKKYGNLIATLSNEEAGKILKKMFWIDEEMAKLTKVYSDIIMVDIWNMEIFALNWSSWGRPKKEKPPVITPGYENEKPPVTKNDNINREINREINIKESKIENKDNENKKENIKEKNKHPMDIFYENSKNIEPGRRNVTEHLVVCFYDLWYKPPQDETADTFRQWLIDFSKYKHKTADQVFEAVISWHTYWKEQKKQIKNFKTSFWNHYSFKN